MMERVALLYQKCLLQTASEAERQELLLLLQHQHHETQVKDNIAALLAEDKPMEDVTEATMQSLLRAIYAAEENKLPPAPASPFYIKAIKRYGWWAAAAVLLFAVIQQLRPAFSPAPATVVPVISSVAPGYNKAVLTLSSGEVVILDSTRKQQLQQGNSILHQQGSQLSYNTTTSSHTPVYNTLATPRGGQYKVILADGTQVWLNAASSLRYPTSFSGGERLVEIYGEAYFEVARNEKMPFRVKINGGTTIEVLGTQFNVNAYAEEKLIKTTLVVGSIRLKNADRQAVLYPGQQAQTVPGDPAIAIHQAVDINQVTAWKKGLFDFNRLKLVNVMQQLSRWYDIEVVYEKSIPDITFWGKMGRDLQLADVLLILEKSDVHFRITDNGKKLIVTP